MTGSNESLSPKRVGFLSFGACTLQPDVNATFRALYGMLFVQAGFTSHNSGSRLFWLNGQSGRSLQKEN